MRRNPIPAACVWFFTALLSAQAQQDAAFRRNQPHRGPSFNSKEASVLTAEAVRTPLVFERNQGQAAPSVQYLARNGAMLLLFASNSVTFALPVRQMAHNAQAETTMIRTVRLTFPDASPKTAPFGVEPLVTRINYYRGEPTQWRTNIPTYAAVGYGGIYSGVDAIFYAKAQVLEYDLCLAPGTDASSVSLKFEGADRITLDAAGNLVLHVGSAMIVNHRPRAFEIQNGSLEELPCWYRLADEHTAFFQLPRRDARRTLLIDPVLSFSTCLGGGGAGGDQANGIGVDAAGNIYVSGYTGSIDFPSTNAVHASFSAQYRDVFVSKFDPAGRLLFSTYLGCSTSAEANGLAVDASGNAYVTGNTSGGFPVTAGAFQTTWSGSPQFPTDAFVTKLNSSGQLVYSTYLGGGTGNETAFGIAVDSAGNAYVGGMTTATDFPTTAGAYQTRYGGGTNFGDAFITKLNPTGTTALYSTYLGSTGDDQIKGLTVDSAGCAYLTGGAGPNFPVTAGAFQTSYQGGPGGGFDAFVAKLNATGSALLYSTYLAGPYDERGFGVAVDAAGFAYVTGNCGLPGLATPGAFQSVQTGQSDAYVAKINTNGTSLVYLTYLGGSDSDAGRAIRLDSSGNVYVAGNTRSTDFPLLRGIQSTNNGSDDAFVAKLAPDGTALFYSTLLGGNGEDQARALEVDSNGVVYVAGYTFSTNFPVLNARQSVNAGNSDAFVFKLFELRPTLSVSNLGNSQLRVLVAGETGAVYGVEGSTNLQTWLPLANGTATNGSLEFTDNTLGFLRRYYRSILQR